MGPETAGELSSLRLFSRLSDAELESVRAASSVRSVKKGAILVLAQEFAGRIGVVWSGSFNMVMSLPPKRMVTLARMRRGAVFGFIPGIIGTHFGKGHRLRCHEPGAVLEFDAARLRELRLNIPALCEAFLVEAAMVAADFGGRIFELSALSVRERLQAELLRAAREADWRGKVAVIDPAPTHQELADLVGAAREVISRTMGALASEGLLRNHDGILEIVDVEGLIARDKAATGRVMFDIEQYAKGPR